MQNSNRSVYGLVAAIFLAACSGGGGCTSDDPRPSTSDCQECSVSAAVRDFEDCFEDCYAGCDELLISDTCAPPLPAVEECGQGDSSTRPQACACRDCANCIEECDGCPGDGQCLAKLTEEGTPADTDAGRCGPPSLFGLECSDGTYLPELEFDPGFAVPQPGTMDCQPCDVDAVGGDLEPCLAACSSGDCPGTTLLALLNGALPVGTREDSADPCNAAPESTECAVYLCLSCVEQCLGCGLGSACMWCSNGSCGGDFGVCSATKFGACAEGEDTRFDFCQRPLRCRGTLFETAPEVSATLQTFGSTP